MIRRKTVLILGAGASAEAGFPVGSELKARIANGVKFRFAPFELTSGDRLLYDSLRHELVDNERLNRHTVAGNKLSEVMPSFLSIDEALHWYSQDTELVFLGKLAIARFIIEAEKNCELNKIDGSTGKKSVAELDSSWLPHFFSTAIGAAKYEDVETLFENVTIISFNYDRCVEQYLYMALQERAGVSEEKAKAAVNRLKIIRPYGSLGSLDWQDQKSGLPFGGKIEGQPLFPIAGRIRTYTEQLQTQIEQDINIALRNSYLTMILGFGFHPQNMSLLTNCMPNADGAPRRILGSVYKIDEENYGAIENELAERIGGRPHTVVRLLDRTSAQIFERLRPTINMAVN